MVGSWWDPGSSGPRPPSLRESQGLNPRKSRFRSSHFWGIKLHYYVHSWNPHLPVRVLYLEPVAPSCQYIRQRLTPCSKYIGNWKIRERYEIMETTTKWVPTYQLQNGVEKNLINGVSRGPTFFTLACCVFLIVILMGMLHVMFELFLWFQSLKCWIIGLSIYIYVYLYIYTCICKTDIAMTHNSLIFNNWKVRWLRM